MPPLTRSICGLPSSLCSRPLGWGSSKPCRGPCPRLPGLRKEERGIGAAGAQIRCHEAQCRQTPIPNFSCSAEHNGSGRQRRNWGGPGSGGHAHGPGGQAFCPNSCPQHSQLFCLESFSQVSFLDGLKYAGKRKCRKSDGLLPRLRESPLCGGRNLSSREATFPTAAKTMPSTLIVPHVAHSGSELPHPRRRGKWRTRLKRRKGEVSAEVK